MNGNNKPTHGVSAPKAHITPRQREILRRVAEGLTNREIGVQLVISTRTVEVHRRNIMAELNVHNVAQLLRRSVQRGLLARDLSMK